MLSLIRRIISFIFGISTDNLEEEAVSFDPTEVKYLEDDYYDVDELNGNIPSVPDDFEVIAEKMSSQFNVPKELICAIGFVESNFRKNAFRYEPMFQRRYIDNHPDYSDLPEDERRWLSTSWGYMQIMAATAIDLGYQFDYPEQITEPELNVEIGTFFLRKLFNRYKSWEDAISAYNQGNNRKSPDGSYANQAYVSKVLRYWDKYKS
jgi:hypothetical protein